MLGIGDGWTTASLTMQLTSGVSVFAHVWEQMLDTLSNFCDYNIHSAIYILYFAMGSNSKKHKGRKIQTHKKTKTDTEI